MTVAAHINSMWKGMKPVNIIWAHSSNQKKPSTAEVRCGWGEMGRNESRERAGVR